MIIPLYKTTVHLNWTIVWNYMVRKKWKLKYNTTKHNWFFSLRKNVLNVIQKIPSIVQANRTDQQMEPSRMC